MIIVVYAIFIAYILYALNFDHLIIEDTLYALINIKQAIIERVHHISLWWLFIVIVLGCGMGYFLNMQNKKQYLKIDNFTLLFFSIIVFIVFVVIVMNRNNIRLGYFVKHTIEHKSQENIGNIEKYRKIQKKEHSSDFIASKNKKKETYVVVIPESLNKGHMGIYGYMRDTTPCMAERLKSNNMLLFNNIYTSQLNTRKPLPPLSLNEINQYNNIPYQDAISVIDVLNKAEFETYWLTTQSINSSKYKPMSIISKSADHLINLKSSIQNNKTEETVIKTLNNVLKQKSERNRVIFIYLGNRWSYSSRYDKEKYNFYGGDLPLGEFGSMASGNSNINHYDNNVRQIDHIVDSILEILQKEKGVSGLLLIPEYPEEATRNSGHFSEKITYDMIQIPMIAWFSDDYIKEYRNKYNILSKNTDRLFSNDMLYDTLLGLFDVSTSRYNHEYDLSSKKYKIDEKNAFILYGQKSYINKDNYIYWQKANIKYLIDRNISGRIIPPRVTTIGKLRAIWNDGFRSFEMDVNYGIKGTDFFHIGHHLNVLGVNIEDFFESVVFHEIRKVWLHSKNLNQNNYRQALTRLQYLYNKYKIKAKFIVESSTTL
ncbi:MAG TPA: phosphoethanolamine transferase, partial [Arcobacter sp.]|nr:phosphoethanolamine transferase [Arcobacter sp.]